MNIFIHQEKSGSNNKKQTYLSEIHTQNNDKQGTSVGNSVDEVFLRRYTKITV